jgi:hypothetical protein
MSSDAWGTPKGTQVESGVAEALGGSQSESDEDGEEDEFLHRRDPIRTRTDSPVSLSQLLLAK